MKKDDVKIGSNYLAKVSDKVVSIRIDAENRSGGWDATNLATGKKIRIKSAQRLRGPAGKKGKATKQAAESVATDAPTTATVEAVEVAEGVTNAKPKKPNQQADKPKRASAIDAAAQVLRDAKAPMRCKEMIAAMVDHGLWSSPNGKTPEATLYSAIIREIGTKGGESRFRKTERGLFETNA
jgi:hypothetical protein